MGKSKKKQNKKLDSMTDKQFIYFSNYARKANQKQMDAIKGELSQLLEDIEKDERKFSKQKAKVKHGEVMVDMDDYIRKHPKYSKRRAVDLLQSTDFINVVKFLSKHGKTIAIVVAQMVATLIVIVLSSKEIRETLSTKAIKKMQKTYKVCSDFH